MGKERGVAMRDWEAMGDQLWKALAEVDGETLQAEAEKAFRMVLIGAPGCGKTTLASVLAAALPGESMAPDIEEHLAEYRLPLSVVDVTDLDSATLFILLLDATKGDYTQEVAAADYLSYLGKPMLVCYNKMDLLPVETRLIRGQARWRGVEIMPLSATQADTVRELLVPAVLEVLPEHALTLARHLPLFRGMVADKLIERMALVNATYASASGLAESSPLRRTPLSAEDMEVLSANHATMAYRLGLVNGLALDWHQDIRGVSSAVDAGRLWQHLARQVRGLMPLWGLSSKVSIAYGGTVLIGRAIEAWCETGQALSPKVVRTICRETAGKSRAMSGELVARAREALPAPQTGRGRSRGVRLRVPRPRLPKRRQRPMCPACGRANPVDAAFCAYCGASLVESEGAPQAAEHQSGTGD
jgi:energy-coupling factor transporter ATP-binding protein EcfA2